jgi:hypothetical protein
MRKIITSIILIAFCQVQILAQASVAISNFAKILKAAQSDFKDIKGKKISKEEEKYFRYAIKNIVVNPKQELLQADKETEPFFLAGYDINKEGTEKKEGLKMFSIVNKYIQSKKDNLYFLVVDSKGDSVTFLKTLLDEFGNPIVRTINAKGVDKFLGYIVYGKTLSENNIDVVSAILSFIHGTESNFAYLKGEKVKDSTDNKLFIGKKHFGSNEEFIVEDNDSTSFAYAYFDYSDTLQKAQAQIVMEDANAVIKALVAKGSYTVEHEVIELKKVTRLKNYANRTVMALIITDDKIFKVEFLGQTLNY